MQSKEINRLLKYKEYQTLKNNLPDYKSQNLSLLEKQTWVEVLAATMDAYHAMVLYEHFGLADSDLLAKIYCLTGLYDKAVDLADKIQNKYLVVDALLGLGRPDDAKIILKNLSMNADWYYELGRCYAQTYDYKQAIGCMQQAAELFKQSEDIPSYVNAKANEACYLHTENNFEQADNVLFEVDKYLKKSTFKMLPEFFAKILLNQGGYYLDLGQMYKAYRRFKMAQKSLANFSSTHDYERLNIQLAYIYMDFGAYQKSIRLLKTCSPRREYMKFDKYRILASCYMRLGDANQSLKAINKAQELSNPSDPFARIYFGLDMTEYLYSTGQIQMAQLKYDEVIKECQSTNDVTAEYISNSRWSWLTKNSELASELLNHPLNETLRYYSTYNSLTVVFGLMKSQKFDLALSTLTNTNVHGLAIQKCYKDLFEIICQKNINKEFNNESLIQSCFKQLKKTDDLALKYQIIKNLSEEISNADQSKYLLDVYTQVSNSISPVRANMLDANTQNISLTKSSHLTLILDGKRTSISMLDLVKIKKNENLIVIDLDAGTFESNHQIVNLKSNPVQLKLLRALATATTLQLSKEQIANSVFDRKEYNPLFDDNLIYVAINRLRKVKFLTGKILCIEGKYSLNTANLAVIFQEPTGTHRALSSSK